MKLNPPIQVNILEYFDLAIDNITLYLHLNDESIILFHNLRNNPVLKDGWLHVDHLLGKKEISSIIQESKIKYLSYYSNSKEISKESLSTTIKPSLRKSEKTEKHYLENTNDTLVVHSTEKCLGQVCTIHQRSNHGMRSFPQHYRFDRNLMERTCPHGVGHPDPDDPSLDRTHGCDGCCL